MTRIYRLYDEIGLVGFYPTLKEARELDRVLGGENTIRALEYEPTRKGVCDLLNAVVLTGAETGDE